ncbi:MAG: protease modulator HflC [Gammaproteobacteria bacterium]
MSGKAQLQLFAFLLIVFLAGSSVFTVSETEQAVLFQFGEIVQTDYEPGLHFKLPWINTARKFPRRILTLESDSERFLIGEQKYVMVDFFVKWRISNVQNYYRATAGSELSASRRLLEIMKNGLKNEFASRSLTQVISEERSQIMEVMTISAQVAATDFGMEIVDVRVKQIELPPETRDSIFERMKSERRQHAAQLRAEGSEAAEKLRAAADRQRTVILANAFRESQQTRGEGDARSAEIYAAAYERDSEFFSFYRSLQSYRTALGAGRDILVIEPESDFFKYFNDGSRRRP